MRLAALVAIVTATVAGLAGAPTSSGAASAPTPSSGRFQQAQSDEGWEKHSHVQAPPGRARHAMAWDADRGEIIMFGGYKDNTDTAWKGRFAHGTWAWDGTHWRELVTEHKPPYRADHEMAYDPVRDEVVLYGGQRYRNDGRFHDRDDTWVFADGDWARPTRDETPGHVAQATMAYDPLLQQVIMFGGIRVEGHAEYLQETWTWDGATWRELHPETSPPLRENATLAFDPARERLVLFGGTQYLSLYLNDTWSWDGTIWEEVDSEVAPPARTEAGMSTFGDDIVLFGGEGSFPFPHYGDTWLLTSAGWEQREPEPAPRGRIQAGLEWDPVRDQAVLFGGRSREWFHQTWTLTPSG